MYRRSAETRVPRRAMELSLRRLRFPTRKKVIRMRRVAAVNLKKKNLKEKRWVLKIAW